MVSEAKKKRKSTNQSEVVNQKSKYESSPFRRGRPPIHDTAYIPNNEGQSPEKGDSALVEFEVDPNEPEHAQLDSDANLKPNSSIQVFNSTSIYEGEGALTSDDRAA